MNTLKIATLALLAVISVGAQAQTINLSTHSGLASNHIAVANLIRPQVIAGFGQVMIMNFNSVSVNVTYQVTIMNDDLTTSTQTRSATVGPRCNYVDNFSGQNVLSANVSDFEAA